jgi:DNA-binding NarL/FixJ family response regulator
MAANLHLLWKRLQDARVKLRQALNDVQETNLDNAAILDHALRVESLAVQNYLHALQEFRAAAAPTREDKSVLTPREREVLTLIASGKSSKKIAEQIGIGFKTAVTHRYNLQKKLNAHNTAELTKAALRMGLIEL